MKLLQFKPSYQNLEASPICQTGTIGYGYKVEIWTNEKDAVTGKRYYTWLMPIYNDESGNYIDFSDTKLKEVLGKIYLKDIKNYEK